LAKRHKIGITALIHPAASQDQIIAKIAKMRDRPAERRDAEFQKGEEDFSQSAADVFRLSVISFVAQLARSLPTKLGLARVWHSDKPKTVKPDLCAGEVGPPSGEGW
jgi:hypothetical protein